jgi:hypothetical protein
MTTIRLGLSATSLGQTPGQPWDANWMPMMTGLAWIDSVLPAESSGFPLAGYPALGTTFYTASGDSVDLPIDQTPDQYEQDLFINIAFSGATTVSSGVSIDSFLSILTSGQSFTQQDITLSTPWNSIKDIEVNNLSSQMLNVTGFVDTWIDAPADNNDHTISINDVKRGAVALGDGDDTLLVNIASNEYTWSNHFAITAGDGNDTVYVIPEAYWVLARIAAPPGETFNSKPQLTTADITVGNGNDLVGLSEVSGTIHVGGGNDTINIVDGNSTIWLGVGNDTVNVGTYASAGPAAWADDTPIGTTTIHVGTGHADITIDDTRNSTTISYTTIDFIHGETGGSAPDVIRYGHTDPSTGIFVGGSLSAVVLNLIGYGTGAIAAVLPEPPGVPMTMTVSNPADGINDILTLYGHILSGGGGPRIEGLPGSALVHE